MFQSRRHWQVVFYFFNRATLIPSKKKIVRGNECANSAQSRHSKEKNLRKGVAEPYIQTRLVRKRSATESEIY
jgi:hypothetical protein